MSVENAIEFYKKMATDPAFRAKLEVATPDQRVRLAREAGFTFSRQDYEKAVSLVEDSRKGELSDKDLEKVAGGIAVTDIPVFPSNMMYGGNWFPPGGGPWDQKW